MNSPIVATNNSRSTITATVGFMCWALMFWMLSMSHAGWYTHTFAHGIALLMPLSVLLAIMGILSFIDLHALDAVIFFGGAGLFWSVHASLMGGAAHGGAAEPVSYVGWYAIVWAVYFFYIWLGHFRGQLVRMLFLLGAWLSLLALAISAWGLGHVLMLIGGYLGLATAVLAAIISASTIMGRGPGVMSAGGT
ncbi:MAG: hypothetical protein ACREU2_13945 [Steroidobacteraceae bacterium]